MRLLRNPFFDQVKEAYARGATAEELRSILGRGRAKRGMFEGDLDEGELEIGQVSGRFHEILPAARIVAEMLSEYEAARARVSEIPCV